MGDGDDEERTEEKLRRYQASVERLMRNELLDFGVFI